MIPRFVKSTTFINRIQDSVPLRLSNAFYSSKTSKRRGDSQIEPLKAPIEIKLDEPEHPFDKTFRLIKRDLTNVKNRWFNTDIKRSRFHGRKMIWTKNEDYHDLPEECDVLIIGGAAMGSSIAHFLKKKAGEGLKIVIVEKDLTYSKASTVLSLGGIRQQFSLEENIEMSLFGAEFIRNINDHLSVVGQPPVDIQYRPYGYLFLASEKGAEDMIENAKLQRELGAKNILLKPEKLKERFPWMNIDDVALGCLGVEKEGWFDPWSFLYAFQRKCLNQGIYYVEAEVIGFLFNKLTNTIYADSKEITGQLAQDVIIQTSDGKQRKIQYSQCVIAAGPNSGEIAKMARIGSGPGVLSVPLPVEPRKRFVYCFHSPEGPGINLPMTIDPSGTYFRREGLGGNYICGRCPNENHEEPNVDNLEVDHEFFNDHVWPILAKRVKGFENLKVKSSWAGFYEYNHFDQNGVIGLHPYYPNIYFATGFSGHGIQKSPAVGRAIAELIIDSEYSTIDLTRLSFERFITLEPMRERNVV
ncbi:FAD-dependent oxidoreductase domain-containing protein 1-like isoform X1 [Leptopilina boulardi]|uniref:FAD-dependent oxidoreductase domain-containing protein 1-like isoform X1 n=2 Tax=Leptopilina boulardi TaxID=63433 RepID=UPI0021F5D0E5|nr:FAD-dependent oxidoreductase domain-containing protein 1-like isoform X1 [Leptopilina boulardi]